jgi:tRNA(adenine34) deaminase
MMLWQLNHPDPLASDLEMMRRCIALAKSCRSDREYPFAAVIGRQGKFVCEASNRVRRDGDVTRHAEMVAMSAAQRTLRTRSLDDCTLYSTIEPCAMCAYAIRECGVGRVVFGLKSPVMGGDSRWDILKDNRLSSVMPEVFAPPPDVLAGCMCEEVRKLFRSHHPFAWRVIESRGIFVEQANEIEAAIVNTEPVPHWKRRFAGWTRSRIFDRLWRV